MRTSAFRDALPYTLDKVDLVVFFCFLVTIAFLSA